VWVDQYAYRLGAPAEVMAATYSAMDVLLAPSHGEGFCVPLIEAQACGTPVIATDFSAQPELVGAGWLAHHRPARVGPGAARLLRVPVDRRHAAAARGRLLG
jgi:glycosyltransferase involved in cell wall biosynthesis